MNNNLVSKDNLKSILSQIRPNIVSKINDKDISEKQKESLNKADIIDTTTNNNSFLANNGKYDNISVDNMNDSIDKTNNVYNIFKIEKYDIEEWSNGNPLPTKCQSLNSQIYKDKIYCIGGYNNGALDTVEIYDIKNNKWTNGKSAPTKRFQTTSQIYNGNIYIIGGDNTNIVEIYDIENNTWTIGASMSDINCRASSIIYKNTIYCIGGYNGSNPINKVEIYDIDTNTWSIGNYLPTKRYNLTSQLYNDKIYCIAGVDNGLRDKVEIYDIENNIWTNGKPIPTERHNLTSQIYKDKIYCIGGHNGHGLDKVEIYDIENNTWKDGISMPIAVFAFSSCIYKDKIYCMGGCSDNGNLDIINILSLYYTDYDISLPSNIQNKLDCILDTGLGDKILSDKGEYINIPKGYRFMESNEVTDFINEINID